MVFYRPCPRPKVFHPWSLIKSRIHSACQLATTDHRNGKLMSKSLKTFHDFVDFFICAVSGYKLQIIYDEQVKTVSFFYLPSFFEQVTDLYPRCIVNYYEMLTKVVEDSCGKHKPVLIVFT